MRETAQDIGDARGLFVIGHVGHSMRILVPVGAFQRSAGPADNQWDEFSSVVDPKTPRIGRLCSQRHSSMDSPPPPGSVARGGDAHLPPAQVLAVVRVRARTVPRPAASLWTASPLPTSAAPDLGAWSGAACRGPSGQSPCGGVALSVGVGGARSDVGLRWRNLCVCTCYRAARGVDRGGGGGIWGSVASDIAQRFARRYRRSHAIIAALATIGRRPQPGLRLARGRCIVIGSRVERRGMLR